MAERQKIIETNRSIRTIKNELESLYEKGLITDDSYSSIHNLLPPEAPLHGGAPSPAPRAVNTPPVPVAVAAAPGPSPPTYAQTTSTAPPALPVRNSPAPPPSKPIVARARALYRYAATDARDCSFERDDVVLVFEYMNADWWMGRNERTGQEGIFPKTYVEIMPPPPGAAPVVGYPNEKAGMYGGVAPAQPMYGGYPPPPAQQNPYNSNVPPMAVAEGSSAGAGEPDKQGGKGSEMGKKFGKKLGNAAIFGAGATIGSNIVNSIF